MTYYIHTIFKVYAYMYMYFVKIEVFMQYYKNS